MKRAASLTFAALLAASLAGCGAAPTIGMGTSEYGLYRRARAAPRLEDRLAAAQEYLTKYPGGAHTQDLRTFFSRAEPVYFRGTMGSIGGLEAYLRTLPHGPNADEAIRRLGYLRARRDAESADLDAAAGTALATSHALTREADRRRGVRSRVAQWLAAFLDPRAFALPLAEAPAELIVPWSLSLPWPRCARPGSSPDAPKGPADAATRCVKLLELDYRVTEEGDAQERQALLEIAVWQDRAGRLIEVSIGGPDLFLRLDETVTARGASTDDPEARLRGAELAVEMANAAFFTHRVTAAAACRKKADSEVLVLDCNGVELRVLAGAFDGEDDRFVVRVAR